jgi:hypothetical protein
MTFGDEAGARHRESAHTRRAPCPGVGGSSGMAVADCVSIRAVWLLASDAW